MSTDRMLKYQSFASVNAGLNSVRKEVMSVVPGSCAPRVHEYEYPAIPEPLSEGDIHVTLITVVMDHVDTTCVGLAGAGAAG
ncbi:MAG: hypothetical protein Q6373_013160, partial [Candidatus Sigynarchaeota archaeon]